MRIQGRLASPSPRRVRCSGPVHGLLVLATALACDAATGPPPDPRVPTTVSVTPATTEFTALGDAAQLTAEVRDQHQKVMTGAAVIWASRAETVATVDGSGLVTASGDGEAVISATAGQAIGLAHVTVTRAATISILPLSDTILIGDTLRMTAEALDSVGNPLPDVTFSWVSDQSRIASVNESGLVRATGTGMTTKVTITAKAGSVSGTSQITVFSPERAALIAFYERTGGPSWVEDDGWLSDRPIGFWHGVDANQAGRVTALKLGINGLIGPFPREAIRGLAHLQRLLLHHNGLRGELPAELGNLTELRELSLHHNRLTGRIPEELGGLPNLRLLSLSANGLTGEIPVELASLTGLEELDLYDNQLTGRIPPAIGDLIELTWLILHGNELSGPIPPELGNLNRLVALSLSDNRLTGQIPATLGNLGNGVHWLEAAGNALTGPIPPELGELVNLDRLRLHDNDLTGGIPPEFGGLVRLRTLKVSGNPRMSGALPDLLTSLPRLRTFMAGGTDLCAPREPGLRTWLEGILWQRVKTCGADEVRVYLTQAVQSPEYPVPLVAGEEALLRVFVTAAIPTEETLPDVRARFYMGGTETHVAEISGSAMPIPTEVDESSLAKSANSAIPGAVLQPGLEMVIEIDPDGKLDPALGVRTRIPETGRMPVNVKAMPVFNLTLIPFLYAPASDSSILEVTAGMAADPRGHEMLLHTRTLLPVGEIDVKEHAPVLINSPLMLHVLHATQRIRIAEGSERFHLGVRHLPVVDDHGYAYPAGRSSASVPHPVMLAKVFGSNLALGKAPCGDPPARHVDADYPHPGGRIGAWGYDRHGDTLVAPATPDLTSYCWPPWISDYHFSRALRVRLDEELGGFVASPDRSLLLSGGVDGDGTPFLDPALVLDAPPALPRDGGEYLLAGRGAAGEHLFSLRFAMQEVDGRDGGKHFVFALPVEPEWAGELADITLSGPEGSVMLDQHSDLSLAMLRHPVTGEIRGILRDLPEGVRTHADAVAALSPDPGLELLFSQGIPAPAAWRP